MFFAAVIAAAFVEADPMALMAIGLSEIPKNCRLSRAMQQAREWMRECSDFESYVARIEAEFGDLSPVHTVNNALIVIGSMVCGEMDFHQTICTSVAGGLDADCNGATSGSIVGAARGFEAVDSELIPPLNDTIKPLVFGFSDISMSELAERTLAMHRGIRQRVSG